MGEINPNSIADVPLVSRVQRVNRLSRALMTLSLFHELDVADGREVLHALAGTVVLEHCASRVLDLVGHDLETLLVLGEVALERQLLTREVEGALRDRVGRAIDLLVLPRLCAPAEEENASIGPARRCLE